jgi:hypothetical protein
LRSTRDRLASLVLPSRVHLCVCGYPRSGTTLLYNLLCSTLEGFNYEDYEESSLRTLRIFDNHVSKLPFDVLNLGEFRRNNIFSKTIFTIVMMRDLRDLVTSVHAQLPGHYFIGFECSLKRKDGEPDPSGPGIRHVAEAIEGLDSVRGMEIRVLKYEELIADPDAFQEELASRLGLRFKARFSKVTAEKRTEGLRYAGRHQPVDPSLVKVDRDLTREFQGRWRRPEYRERLIEQFGAHPGLLELLCRYGYEPDNRWFEALTAEVAPGPTS